MLLVRFVVAAFITAGVGVSAEPPEEPKFTSAQLDFFETKIRPVLVKHCYECHAAGADEIEGGLLLDSRAGLLAGGDSGPAVELDMPEQSLLIDAIRYGKDSFEMPPSGKLPASVIADFQRWVKIGLPDPRRGDPIKARETIDFEKAREFWSFRPIVKPDPPHVKKTQWPRSPMDHFVLAKLESQNLAPAGDASREVLLRRAYFDLIGLPPTPEAIDAFAADTSPRAFERLVDRLLSSKHFGERWGRHWLDVVRFAESSGGGRTRIFHDAWRFRDYVIGAFNADKPFDRFVAEQLAGDLLSYDSPAQRTEQLTATGYLVLAPTNYELQDKELLRMEVVDEQIDTTGRALLGMSIGCARCHDHKFDPIPTTDYYALAGIFRSTKTLTPGNVSGFVQRALPATGKLVELQRQHDEAVASLASQLAVARKSAKVIRKELIAIGGIPSNTKLAGIVVDDIDAKIVGSWKRSKFNSKYIGKGYLHDENNSKGQKSVTFEPVVPSDGMYEIRLAYTSAGNRAANTPVTIRFAQGEKTLHLDQRKPGEIDKRFVSLGRFPLSKGRGTAVIVSNENTTGYVIADAVQFIAVDRPVIALSNEEKENAKQQAELEQRLTGADAEVKRLDDQIKGLKKKPPPRAMVMSVQEESLVEDCQVCIRGGIRNLGKRVPRGFLTIATRSPLRISEGQSGRLELARWITSRDNPLTARVLVNRIWHHLFGVGIVRTTDNFGHTGELPSHDRLLDHLAEQMMADGWSIKRTIRRIMLSRTYRMSSDRNNLAAAKVDPDNRLLWRQNRKRLEAEAIRDSMLQVSGRLDQTIGGPVLDKNTNTEFGYQFDSVRRSVYVPVLRNNLHDVMAVFDFADPNLVVGRRNTSVLPTQALYLMNSPQVMDYAQSAARRLLLVPGIDQSQRLRMAYRRTLGREASAAEHRLGMMYLMAHKGDRPPGNKERLLAWTDICHALFACLDFRYVR